MAGQNWNDILKYIKRKLGTKLNLLELSDDEIVQNLKDDVVPYFSQYSPAKHELVLTSSDRVTDLPKGSSQWTYKIPVPDGTYIIDIFDVYLNMSSTQNDDPFYGTKYSETNAAGAITKYGRGDADILGGGMIDTVIDNVYNDIADSLSVHNTWEFRPPNIITSDLELTGAVVVYNTVHQTLDTISPDYYHMIFKKLCLVEVQEDLVALRSKFEGLATPFGEIRVNWQKLESDAERERDVLQQKLDMIPPDHFIHITA